MARGRSPASPGSFCMCGCCRGCSDACFWRGSWICTAQGNSTYLAISDYRIKRGDRQKVMRLATPEFIRRFLMHVLPPLGRFGFAKSPAWQWTGSTASATTASWPAQHANQTSQRFEPCSVFNPLTKPLRRSQMARSFRSHCANLAPAAAARCASSRSSDAVRNQCCVHLQGNKPHNKARHHTLRYAPIGLS